MWLQCSSEALSIKPLTTLCRCNNMLSCQQVLYYRRGYNITIAQLELNLTTTGTGDTRILMSSAPHPGAKQSPQAERYPRVNNRTLDTGDRMKRPPAAVLPRGIAGIAESCPV